MNQQHFLFLFQWEFKDTSSSMTRLDLVMQSFTFHYFGLRLQRKFWHDATPSVAEYQLDYTKMTNLLAFEYEIQHWLPEPTRTMILCWSIWKCMYWVRVLGVVNQNRICIPLGEARIQNTDEALKIRSQLHLSNSTIASCFSLFPERLA